MPEPYVGITGFKSRGQLNAVLPALSGPRKLMVGVLASQRTLVARKREWRSPEAQNIPAIFPPGNDTLNLVHYYTRDQKNLADQLAAVRYFGGERCHGFQFNIAWPDRMVLMDFKLEFPETVMVIQLGGRLWPLTDIHPLDLAKKVLDLYDGIADYVLLDPSGGLGIPIDESMLRPYMEALATFVSAARRPMGLVIAGGLHADNLEIIRPFCELFPGLSFDAEGRLHSGPGQLDADHCRRYLQRAATLPV
jgi:hypothetical protein